MKFPEIRKPFLASGADTSPTRRSLVQTALEQIAQYGPHGATLSQIRASSGQSNRSAIHYHFGNKSGLMLAVIDHIEMRLVPLVESCYRVCESRRKEGVLTKDELIRSVACPVSTLFKQDASGQHCVRVLSHLLHDSDSSNRVGTHALLWRLFGRFLPFTEILLPASSPQMRAKLLLFGVIQMVEVLTFSVVNAETRSSDAIVLHMTEAEALQLTKHFYSASTATTECASPLEKEMSS